MADRLNSRQTALLSDRDTTTPELDPNTDDRRRKRQRTKRHRKRNTVSPGRSSSPGHGRLGNQARPLRLQPIETSGLKGKDLLGFRGEKPRTFGVGGNKGPAVTFRTGPEPDEVIKGDITITNSYASLKELAMAESVSDHKSSQKTQSTSLTSMSSASPMLNESEPSKNRRSQQNTQSHRKHRNTVSPGHSSPPGHGRLGNQAHRMSGEDVLGDEFGQRSSGFSTKRRRGFWWEAYNTQLVKSMTTCLLVATELRTGTPSLHTQIIDHFIEKYRTISFTDTKSDAPSTQVQLDLKFVAKCLDTGVDVDQVDSIGQTVLMEAVRSWHLDVIQYLLDNEADVAHHDHYGRAPIHVAAAANRPAVIHLLLERGAHIDSKIPRSGETPLHLASRRGSLLSVEALLERGANLESRDYRGRTPFHLAAEFGKTDMVEFLLKNGAKPFNVDSGGFSSLIHVIQNCPKYIDRALDSLIKQSDVSEKLQFDPTLLEHCPDDWREKVWTNCLLDTIESQECGQAIRHIIIQTMIKTRWDMFGKLWALVNFFFRFLFFATWTSWILAIHWEEKHHYDWNIHWWRGILPAFGVFFLGWEIKIEWLEAMYSITRGLTMARTRLKQIESDLKHFLHPSWKDEEDIMLLKERETRRLTHWWRQLGLYGRDLWNIYDFIIFAVIILCMITHILDSINHDTYRARLHGQLGSVTILLLGIRLMKDTRGFFGPGQLVIMLGLMASDFGRFIFLYLQLYIPFTIAFWIIFGDTRYPYYESCQVNCSPPVNCTGNCTSTSYITQTCDIQPENCVTNRTPIVVEGMESYPTLCFSLFRLTLIDEYDLDTMRAIDPYMSIILVSAFLLTSAIVGINFLIGLISNVLGDGAREHVEIKSLLQKLRVILLIEQTRYMCGPRPDRFLHELNRKHHELNPIRDFKQDNTFSFRDNLAEVKKSVCRLGKLIGGVIEQQEELLEQTLKLQRDIQRPRIVENEEDEEDFSGGQDHQAELNLSPFRPMSRAMKMSSALDLSMSYSHKSRDVDAEHEPRKGNARTSSINYIHSRQKSVPRNRITVDN